MIFEGTFDSGVRFGPGILYSPNGDRLDAVWEGGKIVGPVKIFTAQGHCIVANQQKHQFFGTVSIKMVDGAR